MKKKKKVMKNKKLTKRVKIIIVSAILLIVSVVGVMIYYDNQYMNFIVRPEDGCPAGYYFYNIFIRKGCRECPKGQYCPGDNKHYSCPKGYTTLSKKSKYSTDCGYCQDETKYFSKGECVTCEKGYYCQGGRLNQCPKGKTTKKTGSKNLSDCVCEAGKYYSDYECKTCPKCNGNVTCFTSPVGSKSVNQCTGTVPAGRYITCNTSGCTVNKCTGNTYSTKKTVKYSSKLKTTCTACGTNKVANAYHSGCICAKGTYASGNDCKTCPKCNGNVTCFSSKAGSRSVNSCVGTVPAGKYITCNASGCTVKNCEGNTYSERTSVSYSSKLATKCTSCGSKKANSTHTGCI